MLNKITTTKKTNKHMKNSINSTNYHLNSVGTFNEVPEELKKEILSKDPDFISYKKQTIHYDNDGRDCYDVIFENNIAKQLFSKETGDLFNIIEEFKWHEYPYDDDSDDYHICYKIETKIVSSEYWYTETGLYRRSDHWDSVASCYWEINKIQYDNDIIIGFCEWSDFKTAQQIKEEYQLNMRKNYIEKIQLKRQLFNKYRNSSELRAFIKVYEKNYERSEFSIYNENDSVFNKCVNILNEFFNYAEVYMYSNNPYGLPRKTPFLISGHCIFKNSVCVFSRDADSVEELASIPLIDTEKRLSDINFEKNRLSEYFKNKESFLKKPKLQLGNMTNFDQFFEEKQMFLHFIEKNIFSKHFNDDAQYNYWHDIFNENLKYLNQ